MRDKDFASCGCVYVERPLGGWATIPCAYHRAEREAKQALARIGITKLSALDYRAGSDDEFALLALGPRVWGSDPSGHRWTVTAEHGRRTVAETTSLDAGLAALRLVAGLA